MDNIEKRKVLTFWMNGDMNAVALCEDLEYVLHLWDDLHDQDKTRSKDEIANAFTATLINIPSNPFYQRFGDCLRTKILDLILEWHAANALETGDETDRDKAYVLRAQLFGFYNVCAYFSGGLEWARKIAPEVWRAYGETRTGYLDAERLKEEK